MKTNLFFYIFLFFIPISVFGNFGGSSLQIDLDNRNTYKIEIGDEDFYSRGGSFGIDNLDSGFYPINLYKLSGRNYLLVYSGGINLAPGSVTYSYFKRGELIVSEVVPYDYPEISVMGAREFGQFLEALKVENFDSSKMDFLKTQIHFQYFTSQQLAEILDQLSFESSKLEIAKLAFVRTVDPQNYYLVGKQLNFSSSRDELNSYIRKQIR